MEWNSMQVTVTNQEGEIFSETELGPVAASQLRTFIENHENKVPEGCKPTVHDLIHALKGAADNVQRGATTDETDLILSERG